VRNDPVERVLDNDTSRRITEDFDLFDQMRENPGIHGVGILTKECRA
jgi:hypothetical protein